MSTKKASRKRPWPPKAGKPTDRRGLLSKYWPLRDKVYFIHRYLMQIMEGWVVFYNPALEGPHVNYGTPFYNILSDEHKNNLIDATDVAAHTPEGKARISMRLAYLQHVQTAATIQEIVRQTKRLEAVKIEAERLEQEAQSMALTHAQAAAAGHYCECCGLINYAKHPKARKCKICKQEAYRCCIPRAGTPCPHCLVEGK